MTTRSAWVFSLAAITLLLIMQYMVTPFMANAQTNVGLSADQMCDSRCKTQAGIAKEKKDPTLNCLGVPQGTVTIACGATPAGGAVTGRCMAQQGGSSGSTPSFTYSCKADKATGTSGQGMSVGGLGQLLGAISGILGALKGGQPGGGSGGSTGFPTTGTSGCTQYYAVSTPSSDPCAYYVPNASSNINTDTTGTNGTGSTGAGNSINELISGLLNTNTNTNGNTGTDSNGNTSSATSTAQSGGVGVSSSTAGQATGIGPGGPNGEIRVLPNGATIVITNLNGQGNSIVAGFLGSGVTGNGQPQGIVATWCQTRPWASNFLTIIIPANFFDNLCTLRGFQVGLAPAGGTQFNGGTRADLTQTHIPAQNSTTSQSNYQGQVPTSPQMTVDIWATPASVPLGTRTTIFWTSKNAATCTETSPDGSFLHTTLSGGGATVPLSGPTTFTISCTAPDGAHATDFVIVKLSI